MIAKCRGPHYVGDLDVIREYDDGYSRWTRRRCPLCGLTLLWDEDNGIVVNGPEWRELAKRYPDNIYLEEGEPYEARVRPHGGVHGAGRRPGSLHDEGRGQERAEDAEEGAHRRLDRRGALEGTVPPGIEGEGPGRRPFRIVLLAGVEGGRAARLRLRVHAVRGLRLGGPPHKAQAVRGRRPPQEHDAAVQGLPRRDTPPH